MTDGKCTPYTSKHRLADPSGSAYRCLEVAGEVVAGELGSDLAAPRFGELRPVPCTCLRRLRCPHAATMCVGVFVEECTSVHEDPYVCVSLKSIL